MKLPLSYYLNPDAEFLARDLLGKILFTRTEDGITAGMIVETEAYFGTDDKASHAYGGRRTARTETMYSEGGTALSVQSRPVVQIFLIKKPYP